MKMAILVRFLTWSWSRVLVCGLHSHGESKNGLGSSRKNSGQTIFLQSLEKTLILRWSGTEIFPSGYPIFSYIWCLLAVRFTHEFLQNLLKLKNNSSFVSGWILVFSFMGKENTQVAYLDLQIFGGWSLHVIYSKPRKIQIKVFPYLAMVWKWLISEENPSGIWKQGNCFKF